MLVFPILFVFLAIPMLAEAAYTKPHRGFESGNFFDSFDFVTMPDPTHGTVEYVDRGTAQQAGLIENHPDGSVYIGVDHRTVIPVHSGQGRRSVRLESKEIVKQGLVILDLDHMPNGCGTWPAFWLFSANWPLEGEIDIIEGVHNQVHNQMALHTGPGCTITDPASDQALLPAWLQGKPLSFRGKIHDNLVDCEAVLATGNRGCSIKDEHSPWGYSFNQQGGGVYAMEWTKDFIKIWMFRRGEILENVHSQAPEPKSWGQPSAIFTGNCDFVRHFVNQKLTLNITFCGDWAGGASWWESDCSDKTGQMCWDFVRSSSEAFKEAYWKIRSLKVWES